MDKTHSANTIYGKKMYMQEAFQVTQLQDKWFFFKTALLSYNSKINHEDNSRSHYTHL